MTVARKEPPYESTTVPIERSKTAIEKLLMDYGAEGVRMTTMRNGTVSVEFILETEANGVRRRFFCRVDTPVIERKHQEMVKEPGRYFPEKKTVTERDPRAELRMVYWYLKALTEAATYGLMSAERTFFSHILFALPDGSQSTAGELAEQAIGDGRAPTVPGFGEATRPALAAPRNRGNVQDAESRVVP